MQFFYRIFKYQTQSYDSAESEKNASLRLKGKRPDCKMKNIILNVHNKIYISSYIYTAWSDDDTRLA